VLSVLDRKWREHLYEMDYLREGISLRGYGQRDPLIEYQREGYDMFNAMMDGIKEESVGNLFNLVVQIQENPIVEENAAPAAFGAPTPVPQVAPPTPPTPQTAPDQAGQPGRRAVPAQGTPRRDGRVSGAQTQSGAGARRSGGAHARPAGAPAAEAPPAAAPIPAGLVPRRPQRLQYSAPSIDGGAHVETSEGPGPEDDFAHVGRNDPCPCGSGRKFKRCHGDPRNVS
jgi:preprotein translocase subunit SecA